MSATYAALDTARRMTEAATRFLETLDAKREALASFPFDSDVRQDWHYVPRSRVGLPRGRMDGTQLESAHALMASGLSAVGARKAEQIIRHESILGRIEGDSAQFLRDPGLYFFNIFGRPGADDSWGWRVEGHHLSLNYTFDGGELQSPTPSFFGANPAEVPDGPEKGLRILETEEELGRDLFMSLNEEHRARAVVYADAPRDMITRADREVALGDPVGLPASAMTADQRDKLMTLVRVYLDKNSEELRARALRKIEAEGVDGIFFAWAGGEQRRQGHYYRLHGPSFFVEYDNVQNDANHIHSVWRDIDCDFGRDLLREHYEHAHKAR